MKNLSVLTLSLLTLLTASFSRAADQPLSLARVLEIAEGRNPDISMQKARVEEANALKKGTPSIPPPMVFGTVMGENGPFKSDGRMENSFGISQTIPFPTKLTSESKVRGYETEAAKSSLQASALKIRAEAKSAFFDLYGARKKIDLLEEKKRVLEEHSRRLRATTLSDRIVQAHRVWIQSELGLAENEIIVAREQERVARGKLNVAMGNDPFTEIPELENAPVSSLPNSTSEIPSSHPELRTLELSQNAANASLSQAKSQWLPDLSLTYRNARRFDGVMPNYSEFTVGVTLPFLYFWQANGQVGAANARTQESVAKIEKTRNNLRQELLESRARAQSLKERLSNYETKILPQAEKRMKIAHGLVPSDMESLNEHREAMESTVNLKLSALALRVEYENAVAKLESLITENPTAQERL